MRMETDALRSVQRYMAVLFADPWTIRTRLDRGELPKRPYLMISRATMLSAGPPNMLVVTLPITVHAFPAPLEDMAASEAEELALRETLWAAVEYGTTKAVSPAKPRRLPLWDFDPPPPRRALDVDGNVIPVRGYCDYLRVDTDPQVSTRRDDDDPLRYLVALDVRCTFVRGQPVPSDPILQRISGRGLIEGHGSV